MPYIERKTISGDLLEIERYFATRDGRKFARSGNMGESTVEQGEANRMKSAHRIRRLIYANFDGARADMFTTFNDPGAFDEAEAMRNRRKLIDQLRKERKKAGLDALKYIVITERQGVWHHHLIMNGGLRVDALTAAWNERGRIMVSTLNASDGYRGLAQYLTRDEKPKSREKGADKQPRCKYARRWSTSRNLEKPIEQKKPIKPPSMNQIPKAPKGYKLLPDWVKGVDGMGFCYIRFECLLVDEAARSKASRSSDLGTGAKPQRGGGAAPRHVAYAQDEKGREGTPPKGRVKKT